MAKAGDRVLIEGTKVGAGRREGVLVAEVGRMMRIRWPDGQESLLTPAPGSVRILPPTSRPKAPAKGPGRAAAAKRSAGGPRTPRKPKR